MHRRLFHIAPLEDWSAAGATYVPSDFERDGFIHCCTAAQVLGVANAYLRGRVDLVLLAIDPNRSTSEIRYENLTGGSELFPHVYGPLERRAIVATERLVPDADGGFSRSTLLGDA
jgi:uncharacterized protein (DUF952 family)